MKTELELLDKQKYLDLIEYLNYCRKLNEKIEEYEVCACIRDLIDNISDYVLGYQDNLSDDVYEFIKTHSDLIQLDPLENIAVFKWRHNFFSFSVEEQEFIKLLKIYESPDKKSG